MRPFIYVLFLLTFSLLLMTSCEKNLEEEVFSELAPENFLKTDQGLISVLGAAYHKSNDMASSGTNRQLVGVEEFCTDIHWQLGGGAHNVDGLFNDFTWDANTYDFGWNNYWRAILNAHIVIESVEEADISDAKKALYAAEARFIRAITYLQFYQFFGPVPLRTSSNDPLALPRASEEELLGFIESELLAVLPNLPNPGEEPNYGRAHKAAARAHLCDFYMMTKQWQKAADQAQAIMDLGIYGLYPSYPDMFRVENERNEEYIWVRVAIADPNRATDCEFMNVCFPADFAKDPVSGLEFDPKWFNFGSNYKLRDNFVNSFEEGDERSKPILKVYINEAGDTIQALGNDDARSFKFWPDPNAASQAHGNDIPYFRYAEILLYRAEALNELNGPNQESIDLINQVRNRAKLGNIALTDFGSKESLRDQILKERGWEFYCEGKRRHDFIRMDKFVESAQARGYTHVEEYRERYPIPQFALDSNPLLKQNEGY